MSRWERAKVFLLLAVGGVGLASRFWLASKSVGCDDADIWKEHANLIATHGLRFTYQHPELEAFPFNHPPLMGYLALWARHVSGSSMVQFAFWIKLPGLLTEVMTAYLIWSLWSKWSPLTAAWAFMAYGTSPTLIAFSGFHGSTDCAYAGLSLLSFYLLCEKRSPLLSGLAMAAALNVKILPVLMIAPLLAQCRSWREVLRWSLGASAGIVPLLPFVVTVPGAVYHNMVAYNSQQLEWGLYAFLKYGNEEAMLKGGLQTLTNEYVRNGRYLILASIIAVSVLAALRSHRLGYQLGAAAWALFLVLTPGYGVQYSVCILPLLFATDVRCAALYGALAGVMLFFIYGARLKLVLPLHGLVQYYPWPKIAVLFGVLAWAVLLGYLVKTVKRLVVASS